LLKIT